MYPDIYPTIPLYTEWWRWTVDGDDDDDDDDDNDDDMYIRQQAGFCWGSGDEALKQFAYGNDVEHQAFSGPLDMLLVCYLASGLQKAEAWYMGNSMHLTHPARWAQPKLLWLKVFVTVGMYLSQNGTMLKALGLAKL